MAQPREACNKNIMAALSRFWRRTPPALFPGLLGLFGLALSWRYAAKVWDMDSRIGEGFGLVATLLLLLTLSSYVVKLSIRPTVLWDDLKIGPARGSVSAGSMCAMALAAFLVPYTELGALLVWGLSMVLHAVYFSCVALMLAKQPRFLDEITPAILLPAVGILVATLAGSMLEYWLFCKIVFAITIPLSALIFVVSLWNVRRFGVPGPLRSSYAIFLAPPSVAAIGIYLHGNSTYFLLAWIGCSVVALCLLPFLRWMSQGGWTPGWGAFTFPLAAFAGVQIVAVEAGFGWPAQAAAAGTLAFATVLIPYIVLRTFQSWAAGKLAEATKAAVA